LLMFYIKLRYAFAVLFVSFTLVSARKAVVEYIVPIFQNRHTPTAKGTILWRDVLLSFVSLATFTAISLATYFDIAMTWPLRILVD
jgi:hypothetical protein